MGIEGYYLRLLFRIMILLARHEMSKDTNVAIKSDAYNEFYDWCEWLCKKATKTWKSSKRAETPGTPENRPLHEQKNPKWKRLWRGPADVPGDYRTEWNSKRSRPCIGTNQASIFSLQLFAQAIQDLGLHWLKHRHLVFIFVFSSILDHEDPEQQLKGWG